LTFDRYTCRMRLGTIPFHTGMKELFSVPIYIFR
jgi:hypothetical protein